MALSVRSKRKEKTEFKHAQRVMKREKRRSMVQRTLITSVVLIVVAVGAGVGYTWYMGKTKPAVVEVAPAAKKKVTMRTPKPNPNAPVGLAIQTLTSPVAPGNNASISIRTNPLATCDIVVEYNKVRSRDSGLMQKKSDEFGTISWAWTVEPNVQPGVWPITMTCANEKRSGMLQANLEVKR